MSFGFSGCDGCCGCCGSSAFEWDADIKNYLTNETCTSCSNASGIVTFKGTPNNFCDFVWAMSINPGDPCNITVPITCPPSRTGLATAICAGFANVSQDCYIGALGAFGANGELHINENKKIIYGVKTQLTSGDNFIIVIDPSVSFILNPCSIYLQLITFQQPTDLNQYGFPLRYYNFTYYAKDNLTSQDFQQQIALPQIYNFNAGSFGNMACNEISSGILGYSGKPCTDARPPSSITVTPVFN